ncbi:MAG TPA: hypothetical protein VMQ73_10735, partial [Methylomirabilota bacterium]|nr:hypothetical protein [Methylomirabilota bacterium]
SSRGLSQVDAYDQQRESFSVNASLPSCRGRGDLAESLALRDAVRDAAKPADFVNLPLTDQFTVSQSRPGK